MEDAGDSKSPGGDPVRVQLPLPAVTEDRTQKTEDRRQMTEHRQQRCVIARVLAEAISVGISAPEFL